MTTTRAPYHSGLCDCGREPGQCVKGDTDHCPALDEMDDDSDDEDFLDCGMGPTSQCAYAGTEWCDWSCPHSSQAAHNRRWLNKKLRALPLFEKAKAP
jgi:hypothetical protein